jgi:hypothetical protein
MATFDRNQIKDFIGTVEDHTAEFIGADWCAARLIGHISSEREAGVLSDAQAKQLLEDAQHLMRCVKLGHKYAKMVRNPSAELRILVLSGEGRTQ